ncbi:hypothetical protein VNO77_33136 [Canavalia gladiata]|uniref:Uncharacterized protein n=1 Tax=Canavalia gladiata TaxID=3824 RepID=A0AAN9KCT0_CANGL
MTISAILIQFLLDSLDRVTELFWCSVLLFQDDRLETRNLVWSQVSRTGANPDQGREYTSFELNLRSRLRNCFLSFKSWQIRDQLPQACSSVPYSAITTGATYESRLTCISLRQTTGLELYTRHTGQFGKRSLSLHKDAV